MKLIEDVKERFQGKKTLLLFGAGLLGLVLILMILGFSLMSDGMSVEMHERKRWKRKNVC